MTRASMTCPHCSNSLGRINAPSGIFHPAHGVRVVFIDRRADVVTIACPVCGGRIDVRARRIDLGRAPP
ncbi:MAG: hypothetical protein ACR2OO_10150 [Thermomicrobiales bacterium]